MAQFDFEIKAGDFADPKVIAILKRHHAVAFAQTAIGSAHALNVADLQSPDIALWTIWAAETPVGCGALKVLSADHGEVKSMHTIETHRGRGAGSMMLQHIIGIARGRGMARLSLQTSTWDFFKPAVSLYRAYDFVECAPFSTYVEDPNSVFMALDISGAARRF